MISHPLRVGPLQLRLLAVALLGLLPMAILSVWILHRTAELQRAAIERATVETMRALASAVDKELDLAIGSLDTLARSPRLSAGDLAGFHEEASEILSARGRWTNIVLLAPDGQQVLNLLRPFGSPLPRTPDAETIASVVKSGKPRVGNMILGPIVKEYRFAVHVPVLANGSVQYVLSGVVDPALLLGVLDRQKVPADGVVSILDAKGNNVARSRAHERWLAKPASPTLLALMRQGNEGWGPSVTLEGEEIYSAYSRSEQTGWALALGIPRAAIDGPVNDSYLALGAGIVLSLLLGLLGSLVGAQAILRPMRALHAAARSVGRGEQPTVPTTAIPEIRDTAVALVEAQSERARAERALGERAEELSRLIDVVPVGIYMAHDTDAARLTANRAGAELLPGTTLSPAGGARGSAPSYRVLGGGRELPGGQLPIHRAARGEEVRAEEFEIVFEDGAVRHIFGSAMPLQDESGRPRGAIAAFLDITERKRVEATLRESEERLRLALNVAQAGVWETDLVTGEHVWGHGMAGLLRVPTESVQSASRRWSEFIHPEDRERVVSSFSSALAEGREDWSADFRALRSDGSILWLSSRAVLIAHGVGHPKMVGVDQDITARKQAEDTLRANESRLRLALEGAEAGVWEVTLRPRSTYWSPEYYALFGYDPLESPADAKRAQRVHPEDLPRVLENFRTGLESDQQGWRQEFRIRHPSRGERWVMDLVRVRRDAAGHPLAISGISLDVTERRRAEEALRDADRRKDQFLATLAHELRNPLAPITMSVGILKAKSSDDPQVRWARDVIDRQVQHMAHLLDDLLDMSRITSGKLELRPTGIALKRVLDSAVETSRPLIEAGRHRLRISLPDDPVILHADPVRLAQVFANLLNNAAKYSDPGGLIELRASVEPGKVRVSVKDEGIGIDSANLGRVFDVFAQLAPGSDRCGGGIGVGLSLVRGLVELHGGTVTAKSEGPGRGSEFVVELPAVEGTLAAPAAPSDEMSAVPHLRVLVADDNADARDSLAEMLRLLGSEVRTARDGSDAVRAAAAFRPDVALLDIGMPQLDGYEAARRIRAQPGGAEIVLVALTGWAQDADKRRARDAGFDYHVTKPAQPEAIEDILRRSRSEQALDAASGAA